MKKRRPARLIIQLAGIALSFLLLNCTHLKNVNEFSAHSLDAIGKFDDIPYDFSRGCLDRCETNAIDSFKIIREVHCPCAPYKKADSLVHAIYRALMGYFSTLEKLSSSQLAEFNIDPLERSIKGLDWGPVQVTAEEGTAYTKLAEVAMGLTVSQRQRHKTRETIEQANTSVQLLLNKLSFIEDNNMVQLLEFKKERLFAYYRSLGKSKLSDYERLQSTSAYYERAKEIALLEQQLKLYSQSLKRIAKGHQDLFDRRDKLSSREVEKDVITLTKDVQDLISKFDKLKSN
jgi:hypothetical protein